VSEMQHKADLPAKAKRDAGHARRVFHGLRKPANWMQLVKFGLVGASGTVVNLAVYSLFVQAFDLHYVVAAVIAWCVAVVNNFMWNRHWTFQARGGSTGFQAPRFFVVSLIALGFGLIVLELLISVAGMPKIPAQAIAIVAATPLNFIGNKLWSFRHHSSAGTPSGP